MIPFVPVRSRSFPNVPERSENGNRNRGDFSPLFRSFPRSLTKGERTNGNERNLSGDGAENRHEKGAK